MRRNTRLVVTLAVVLACAGCDQATKHLASTALAGNDPISLLGDMVRFELTANPGAFLSLGAQLPPHVRGPLFLFVPPALLGFLLVWQMLGQDLARTQVLGFAMIMGGGVGNLIDRIANQGAVVDFMSVGLGPIRTGIFNVADVAVMAGSALVLWTVRQGSKRSR